MGGVACVGCVDLVDAGGKRTGVSGDAVDQSGLVERCSIDIENDLAGEHRAARRYGSNRRCEADGRDMSHAGEGCRGKKSGSGESVDLLRECSG